MTIREKAAMMKLDSSKMASTDIAVRNAALEKIAESLLAGKERIFEANAKDMERAQADNILPAVIKFGTASSFFMFSISGKKLKRLKGKFVFITYL